jgi:dihydrofolate reductase
MSAQLSEGPGEFVSVGGAGRASTLVELDVIDEYRPFVNPVVLGGTPCFPARDERLDLELVEARTFGQRVVYLRYRPVLPPASASAARPTGRRN